MLNTERWSTSDARLDPPTFHHFFTSRVFVLWNELQRLTFAFSWSVSDGSLCGRREEANCSCPHVKSAAVVANELHRLVVNTNVCCGRPGFPRADALGTLFRLEGRKSWLRKRRLLTCSWLQHQSVYLKWKSVCDVWWTKEISDIQQSWVPSRFLDPCNCDVNLYFTNKDCTLKIALTFPNLLIPRAAFRQHSLMFQIIKANFYLYLYHKVLHGSTLNRQ